MVDKGILFISIICLALAIFLFWYLAMKYVFKNVALGDSISPLERLTILEEHKQQYLTHRLLSAKDLKKAPFQMESLFVRWSLEATRYEFVETLDLETQKQCFFWLIGKASVLSFPFNKVHLELKEEQNRDVISHFKSATPLAEVVVEDVCPACGANVSSDALGCEDCELSFA